jgi:hypothetical protein
MRRGRKPRQDVAGIVGAGAPIDPPGAAASLLNGLTHSGFTQEWGPAPHDLEALFTQLGADPPDALDAVHDMTNMPLQPEPQRVLVDLDAMKR